MGVLPDPTPLLRGSVHPISVLELTKKTNTKWMDAPLYHGCNIPRLLDPQQVQAAERLACPRRALQPKQFASVDLHKDFFVGKGASWTIGRQTCSTYN